MAVGDIIADVFIILAGNSTNFQPASGVEIIITQICHSNMSTVDDALFSLFDSTTIAIFYSNEAVTSIGPGVQVCKLGITNENFLRMTSQDSATKNFGFSGVQTK